MQIAGGPVHHDFHSEDPPERVGEGGEILARNAVIRNDDSIALERLYVFSEESFQALAPDLLFSFDHKGQIARQFISRLEIRLDCIEMSQMLAFVVAGAAPKNRTA